MSLRQGNSVIAGGIQIDNTPTSSSSNAVSSGGVYTALSSKATTDLDNLTSIGKVTAANLSMPSTQYIDLTLGASGTTYTAPADGYFTIDKTTNSTNQRVSLYCSATSIFTNVYVPVTNNAVRTFIPVSKGDVVAVNYNAGGTTNTFRFVYANGAA